MLMDMDDELRQQLSRQAAAHSDHLADVLRVQRRELAVQHQDQLREALLKERITFHNEVGLAIARLKGIEAAVDGESAFRVSILRNAVLGIVTRFR